MSPRKVNKEEKRREVAIACSDLLHEVGMKNITVAQVAKTAGIGKGTVYEYFENKEDIIFEIINIHIEEYHEAYLESVKGIDSIKDKLRLFFKFVLDPSEDNQKHFRGYKEYLSVLLSGENEVMFDFNNKCNIFFRDQLEIIFDEAIEKKELKPITKNFIDSIMVFEKGLALMKMTVSDYDANHDFDTFIDNFLELVKVEDNDK